MRLDLENFHPYLAILRVSRFDKKRNKSKQSKNPFIRVRGVSHGLQVWSSYGVDYVESLEIFIHIVLYIYPHHSILSGTFKHVNILLLPSNIGQIPNMRVSFIGLRKCEQKQHSRIPMSAKDQ